jgi:hypothetical protein
MAGNSRLHGGPEDGLEVDVAWPPSPILNRRVGNKIESYELQEATTDDGRMAWKHVDTFDVVAPGSKADTADARDGERDDTPPVTPRPAARKRGT